MSALNGRPDVTSPYVVPYLLRLAVLVRAVLRDLGSPAAVLGALEKFAVREVCASLHGILFFVVGEGRVGCGTSYPLRPSP